MVDDSSKKLKKDLLGAVDGAESAAKENMRRLQNELRDTRLVEQLAKPVRMVIEIIPDDAYLPESAWTRQTEVWNAAKTALESGLTSKHLVGFTSSTTVVSTAALSDITIYCQPLPADGREAVEKSAKEIEDILHAAHWDDRLEAMLVQFGLDKTAAGAISGLDHYRHAHGAYSKPSGAQPNQEAVLIGMRECINRVLSDLFRRCPGQEPAGSTMKKVESIARRIGKPELTPGATKELATDVHDLCKELSDKKQQACDDATLRRLYLQSVGVLKALLDMLDETKARGTS